MVTVLLVGAVLTVVSSTAAFVTIQEFRSTNDDLKSARALGYAEAGLDRVLVAMRQNTWKWEQVVMAGCPGYPVIDAAYDGPDAGTAPDFPTLMNGSLGNGTYSVVIQRDTDTSACPGSTPSPRNAQSIKVTSTGRHPDAMRRVEQTIDLETRGLPIGLYAEQTVDGGGNGSVTNISLITPGNVVRRNQINFVGFDPYYKIGDFFPNVDPSGRYSTGLFTDAERALQIPAAAHALGLMEKTNGTDEHVTVPSCDFNGNNGTSGQSVWDGSGPAPNTQLTQGCTTNPNNWSVSFGAARRFPPTSDFNSTDLARVRPTPDLDQEDYDFLKGAAKSNGLYCSYDAVSNSPTSCQGAGASFPNNQLIQDDNLPDKDSFVVFIDFPALPAGDPDAAYLPKREISWSAANSFTACSSASGARNKSVVIVVRNGSLRITAGSELSGAIFAPEGQVYAGGTHLSEGTVIARRINLAGSGTYTLSDCWMKNMPFTFLVANATNWRELDR